LQELHTHQASETVQLHRKLLKNVPLLVAHRYARHQRVRKPVAGETDNEEAHEITIVRNREHSLVGQPHEAGMDR